MFDSPDYVLAWPRDTFVAEASALIATGHGSTASRIEWLLEDAFSGSTPMEDFRAAPDKAGFDFLADDPWATDTETSPRITQANFLELLIKHVGELRASSDPRPYWPERTKGRPASTQPVLSADGAKRRFKGLLDEFESKGYLERALPSVCVDDHSGVEVDKEAKLEELLGIPGLWPLRPGTWDDDTFYGLIEVFHDLVARPRDRMYHRWDDCGWHYSAFAAVPARALYIWRINKILTSAGSELRLAGEGEDAGRLVYLIADDRHVLVDRALQTPEPKTKDEVRHAIALFRGRAATLQDRRSAVIALARVLEGRRSLLKAELMKGDEGALFHIANEFAIRHESERQKGDYDPVFLDWVFWWYLATIELTDQLLARQAIASATLPSS